MRCCAKIWFLRHRAAVNAGANGRLNPPPLECFDTPREGLFLS